MDRSDVIKLISRTYTQDGILQYVPEETEKQVFCNVRSISRAEWFDAGRSGTKPEYVFTVFAPDYNEEKIVEYNGRRYGVFRTYRGRNETLELHVEAKGGIERQTVTATPGTAI